MRKYHGDSLICLVSLLIKPILFYQGGSSGMPAVPATILMSGSYRVFIRNFYYRGYIQLNGPKYNVKVLYLLDILVDSDTITILRVSLEAIDNL
jgi:hypothetical protein